MKHRYAFILLLLLAACKKNGPEAGSPDHTIVYKTIPGVDSNLLSLDIYQPVAPLVSPAPVVIWVHGGAWALGDKLNQMSYKEALCDSLGYVLVSVNYRLSPQSLDLSDTGAVRYPEHNQDVAAAVAWTYLNIAVYGGDPQKMVLLGHSAGAHLVALTGTDESFLQAEGLDLSILNGVGSFDTEAYDIYTSQTQEPNDVFINAFGNDPLVWQQASPIYHVAPGKNIPPRFLFVERGGDLRKQILHAFADSLTAIGTQVTIIDGNTLSHEEVNEHIGMPDETIMTPAVIQFLQECFQ